MYTFVLLIYLIPTKKRFCERGEGQYIRVPRSRTTYKHKINDKQSWGHNHKLWLFLHKIIEFKNYDEQQLQGIKPR